MERFWRRRERDSAVPEPCSTAKTGGSPQSGAFTAPWDGIHGWYLKNDGPKDVVVKVELAGFYALEVK